MALQFVLTCKHELRICVIVSLECGVRGPFVCLQQTIIYPRDSLDLCRSMACVQRFSPRNLHLKQASHISVHYVDLANGHACVCGSLACALVSVRQAACVWAAHQQSIALCNTLLQANMYTLLAVTYVCRPFVPTCCSNLLRRCRWYRTCMSCHELPCAIIGCKLMATRSGLNWVLRHTPWTRLQQNTAAQRRPSKSGSSAGCRLRKGGCMAAWIPRYITISGFLERGASCCMMSVHAGLPVRQYSICISACT